MQGYFRWACTLFSRRKLAVLIWWKNHSRKDDTLDLVHVVTGSKSKIPRKLNKQSCIKHWRWCFIRINTTNTMLNYCSKLGTQWLQKHMTMLHVLLIGNRIQMVECGQQTPEILGGKGWTMNHIDTVWIPVVWQQMWGVLEDSSNT